MNILITGVAGFIGSNLADRLLSEGKYKVIGIDDLSAGIKDQVPSGIDFYELDVRSQKIYSLFKDVDYVFHLAAKNCISDCQKDPVDTADINVRGSVNVFEAAQRAGVKKIIYAETSALYEGNDAFPTPENNINPETFYAVSKVASMYFAKAFQRYYKLPFTALRYFNVYGPRQDYRRTIPPVMSAFIIKLMKGEAPVIYGNGEKKRDFIYVDDVNDFHLLCLKDTRTDGQVFNLGSGKNYSINQIYDLISELLGTRIQPIYKPDLAGEAQINLADISLATQLGWQPKTDIKKGLTYMLGYIKKEIKEGFIK
jgi:nucleoside-diphosphate-sugar epimerase